MDADGEKKRTVGITCDDYKLEKFKKELAEKGFVDLKVTHFEKGSNLSVITIVCWEADYPVIGRICEAVEAHFKAMKN